MRIKVAQTAGFCWGVRRAMDKVLELRQKTSGPIQTYGPLIHNPQALQSLQRRGIETAETMDDIDAPTIVIRTHGIAPDIRHKLQERAEKLCDGTCPRVGLIHSLIKRSVRDGKRVIIAGDPGHAEVAGLSGYAGEMGRVISSVEEVAGLPDYGEEVVLVAQTTFGEADYLRIAEEMERRYPGVEVHDTICDSTHNRQAEVLHLAKESDAVIVIGGRNSANTRRLAELASTACARTYHVETDEELTPEMFEEVEQVGVSAGASTPHWMIQRVVERLESIGDARRGSLPTLLARFLVAGNIYVSLGAGLLCILTSALLGVVPRVEYGVIAACYIFAMHLLSHYADRGAVGHNEPLRYRLYTRHRRAMVASGVASAAAALGISFVLGPGPGALLLLATLSGLLYSVRIVPKGWKGLVGFRRLKDIPSSKDIFVGIAWSAITVLIPALHMGLPLFSIAVATPLLGVFVLVYIRSVLIDIREISGDRLVGKESLPTVLGSGKSQALLALVTIAAIAWFAAAPLAGLSSAPGILFTAPLAYCAVLLLLFRMLSHSEQSNRRTRPFSGLATEALIDAVFIFAGALGALDILL